jgi:hypothetical protein
MPCALSFFVMSRWYSTNQSWSNFFLLKQGLSAS